ncbi:HET-domain-containing protein, partial [Byssothecium circinans]
PLNYDKKEIRVFRLLPGAWNDPLQCDMEVVSLTDEPTFSALSYVWGKHPEDHKIMIGNHAFRIKPNLYTALRRIRAHQKAKGEMGALWADAVSIEQGNTRERNHQVGLMVDIYSNCDQCFIWLGELA